VRLRSVLHAFRAMSFADACGVVMAKLRARGADTLATAPVPGDLAAPAGDAVARKVHDGALAALSPYWPTPYPGAVAFFRPQTSIFPVAPKRVWRKLVGALTLHPVPGTHTDMVREHAGGLALALSLELHKAGEVAKYG
jgi:thioesterase domain-containing protein